MITLSKKDVGSFYYKRKLTLYNLTAFKSSKHAYCAMWTELTSGSSRNDIASDLISLLKKIVLNHPSVTNIICWSDSCIPHNRNSYISQAILALSSKSDVIESIMMTYSLSRNFCVQEVGNMQKQIEDAMRDDEFCSPLSFLHFYPVIQVSGNDFMNLWIMLPFNVLPHSKVFQLRFTKSNLHVIDVCEVVTCSELDDKLPLEGY